MPSSLYPRIAGDQLGASRTLKLGKYGLCFAISLENEAFISFKRMGFDDVQLQLAVVH